MKIKNLFSFTLTVVGLMLLLPSISISQKYDARPPVPVMSVNEFTAMMEQKAEDTLSNRQDGLKSTNRETQAVSTYQSIRIANGTLIHTPHPWSPEKNPLWIISADSTVRHLGVRLFGTDIQMDIEGIYLNTNPRDAISFHLDHVRDRIIYSQKNGNWIKAYGNNLENYNPGHYEFFNPKGMAVDINDTIYVADSDKGKIVKLVYNRGSASINYVTSFTISGMIHPVDIAIDQIGSLWNPSNPDSDRIWIAYEFSRKLVEIDRGGNIRRQITNCNPFKLQVDEQAGRLAYIDRSQNAFIVKGLKYLNTISTTTFDPVTSSLSCIGQDINNEWWVGDERMKIYHKFTESGQYLASYNGVGSPSGQFDSPVAISKSPYYKSGGTIYRSQYVFTSDR
ncbi:MAG: hypothetical protein QME52_14410 [Bacteroidota bacterium]|nr:hypothetical protein [Bacteroidota bacterium]